jgi:DNA polymerase elongation subunit (family B)
MSRGVRLQPGEAVHYVITDAAAAWPGDRVQAAALLGSAPAYDADAYETLLLKAALAVLTPLGVDAAAFS